MPTRRYWTILVCLTGVLLVAAVSGASQDTDSPTVEDFSWLAGHWLGEGLGGTVEEVWAPPLGGQMLGMFRLIREGKPVFEELMLITTQEGVVTLKVKHFTPEFVGWESKEEAVDFKLERLRNREAFFKGLVIRRPQDDSLEITVTIRHKDGSVRDEPFRFTRYEGE